MKEPKPGAYILQKDGTLVPDLNDEAMAARSKASGQSPEFPATDTSLEEVNSHAEE